MCNANQVPPRNVVLSIIKVGAQLALLTCIQGGRRGGSELKPRKCECITADCHLRDHDLGCAQPYFANLPVAANKVSYKTTQHLLLEGFCDVKRF